MSSKIKKGKPAQPTAKVDRSMKSHEGNPFFVKKAKEDAAFLNEAGLPTSWKRSTTSS
jgi:hypothetical protein